MKKLIQSILVIFFLTGTSVFLSAQYHNQEKSDTIFKHPYNCQKGQLDVPFYKPNSDTTVYFVIHTLFSSMEPLSYLNAVTSYDRKLRDLQNLMPGEGNKALIESNIYVPWTILRGRNDTKDFNQASRVTFNYWGQIRVANDRSAPILPPTNSIGFTWDFAPSDSFRGGFLFGKKKYENGYDERDFYKNCLDSLYSAFTTQLTIMHYSNGQPEGFFSDASNLRHDYVNGDFSTNFIQGLVGYHMAWSSGSILSIQSGYRRDLQLLSGFLQYTPEQEKSYGKHRILMNFQLTSKPFPLWNIKKNIPLHKRENGGMKTYRLKEFFNVQFRSEIEYIADKDLSNWRAKDNLDPKKYRWGVKSYLKINIIRNRNMALVLMHYVGRDYLNIRFDNKITMFQIGLNFKFNKNPVVSFPYEKYIPDS